MAPALPILSTDQNLIPAYLTEKWEAIKLRNRQEDHVSKSELAAGKKTSHPVSLNLDELPTPEDLDNLVVRPAGKEKGSGLFPLRRVAKGDLVVEYAGLLTTDTAFKEEYLSNPSLYSYGMVLRDGLIINAALIGNKGRYANHSCDPNCEAVVEMMATGEPRVMLKALKPIMPNEEICYDYKIQLFKGHESFLCHCKAKNCRQMIGQKKGQPQPNKALDVEKKVYQCGQCLSVLSTDSALRRHVRNRHTMTDRALDCDECPRTFPNKDYLRDHQRSCHQKQDYVHKCTICKKLFRSPSHLKAHKSVHQKTKRFVCKLPILGGGERGRWTKNAACGKAFETDSQLNVHYRDHGLIREEAKEEKRKKRLEKMVKKASQDKRRLGSTKRNRLSRVKG